MPECGNCGSHVTKDFVRVFGCNGEVNGCVECTTFNDLLDVNRNE